MTIEVIFSYSRLASEAAAASDSDDADDDDDDDNDDYESYPSPPKIWRQELVMVHKKRRAFFVIGPSTWNEFPLTLRLLPRNNVPSFCKLLKTFLFGRSWTESASE